MCRSLFQRDFCDEGTILHSDPNHPGIEVAPVYSAKKSGLISFQSKYFDSRINYSEYAWSPGYISQFECPVLYGEDDEFFIHPAVVNYLWEEEFDASQEMATSFLIPDGELIKALGLIQKDFDGIYYCGNDIVAFDMKVFGDKSELVIRKNYLEKFLSKSGFSMVWSVLGEKQYFLGDNNQVWHRRSGTFFYRDEGINGSLHFL